MTPISAERGRRATAVTQIPNRAQSNVVLYDGSGLNVDYGSYIPQHDVVHLAPSLEAHSGIALGDGDIGAIAWTPNELRFQIQKSDLWADSGDGAAPERKIATAGTVSISSDPAFLRNPHKFEQRLSLLAGSMQLHSENSDGACQATAFVSATDGVLVVRYSDQSVRVIDRRIDIDAPEHAHAFAHGETIGCLGAFVDRRYALLIRIVGSQAAAVKNGKDGKHGDQTASLILNSARSTDYVLYITVAVSSSNGDPVAMARSRIQAAIDKGYERLNAEQRQYWNHFWEKSFLRLHCPSDDLLPRYLENQWYLGLYHQASCSRGSDAPLVHGALWQVERDGKSLASGYSGRDLRALLANVIASNHLDLSVPIVDTYYRLLPEFAARTGAEMGLPGAKFPSEFDRFGRSPADIGSPAKSPAATERIADEIEEGLETALLIWDAWRHAQDEFFLRERAYPLLRAAAVFAIERCQTTSPGWHNPGVRSIIATAVKALLWANEEYALYDDLRTEWEQYAAGLVSAPAHRPRDLQPFGNLKPEDTIALFQALFGGQDQLPGGLFADRAHCPDIAFSARLCTGLTSMMMLRRFVSDSATYRANGPLQKSGCGGAAPEAIEIFTGLPAAWGGAFALAAPGGFRISAEAAEGRARYVAIKSLLGGICRVVNPWGPGEPTRLTRGATHLYDSAAEILEFTTEPNAGYLIERQSMPLARAVTVRLRGKPNTAPRDCGAGRIGLLADPRTVPRARVDDRLEIGRSVTAVVDAGSRIDRARSQHRVPAVHED